ncbi:MAG: DNA methyltransferase [Hyphomicrobiaceae bacterium]
MKHWTPPGPLVFDPYGGSGTTLIACERAGRTACVIERDPRYVDVILRRWRRWSGTEPRLEQGEGFDAVAVARRSVPVEAAVE